MAERLQDRNTGHHAPPRASRYTVSRDEESGFGFINREKFRAGFAHDAGDADAAFLQDLQVPINMAAFSEPVAVADAIDQAARSAR